MAKLISNLDAIAEQCRQELVARDEAREKALPLSRDAIRFCSESIRSIHRQEFDQAKEKLDRARELLTEAKAAFAGFAEVCNTGFIRDANKEYAEGTVLLHLVTGKQLPEPENLGIDVAAYLNGMGEAVGELRRYLLDGIRKGDLSRSEELLMMMDDMYNVLVTMDFPDAITSGLRHTTDNMRGVLEKTRSDLTLIIQQKNLEDKLADFNRTV